MSLEITYLAMFGLFTLGLIVVQVLFSAAQHGLIALAGNRDGLVNTGIAGRAERALTNTIFAMALFAPAVLAVQATGGSDGCTQTAVRVFLAARIAYALFYFLGVPWLRTGAWVVGFLCTACLYWTVL